MKFQKLFFFSLFILYYFVVYKWSNIYIDDAVTALVKEKY